MALVSDGAFHKGVDCALKELDVKCASFNQGYELSEEVLRLDNKAKVTEGFLNDMLTLDAVHFSAVSRSFLAIFSQISGRVRGKG